MFLVYEQIRHDEACNWHALLIRAVSYGWHSSERSFRDQYYRYFFKIEGPILCQSSQLCCVCL